MATQRQDDKCGHLAINGGGRCENCGWSVSDEDPLITADRFRQRAALQVPYPVPITDEELRQKFKERFGE
jgi:hypothetical protein